MNWEHVEGKWSQLKGKAREEWAKLTDDDFQLIDGKREKLMGKLQERYGYAKDKAEHAIDAWIEKVGKTPPEEKNVKS